MKALALFCFVLGLVVGWRFQILSVAVNNVAVPEFHADQIRADADVPSYILANEERVEIPREKLINLVRAKGSPALSVDDFLSDAGTRIELDCLAKWADLDDEEKDKLLRILRRAARDRLAWEEKHVRVESPKANEWELHFPSDNGAAKDHLKQEIVANFPPQKASTIEVAGDLDNFFGLEELHPEFKSGTVKILGSRLDEAGARSTSGEIVRFQIWIPSFSGAIDAAGPHTSFRDQPGEMRRFLGLLGRWDEVLEAAAKAGM